MYCSQIQKVECGSISVNMKSWRWSIFENLFFVEVAYHVNARLEQKFMISF